MIDLEWPRGERRGKPLRRGAAFYQHRYGHLYHRTRWITLDEDGRYRAGAWCGAEDYDSLSALRFEDNPPHVCRRCETAAVKWGKPPTDLPLAFVSRAVNVEARV